MNPDYIEIPYPALNIKIKVSKEQGEEIMKRRKLIQDVLSPYWNKQLRELENKNRPLKEEIL